MNGTGHGIDEPRPPRKRISVRYAAIFPIVGSAMITQGLVTTWFAWTEARRLAMAIERQAPCLTRTGPAMVTRPSAA